MRDRLISLWDLQFSLDRRVRVVWYVIVAILLVCVLGLPGPRTMMIATASLLSVLCVLAATGWSVFHPRSLLPALPTVWRWSGWLSVIGVVGIYAGAIQLATSLLSVPVPAVGMLSALLVLLPLLFAFFFTFGSVGAAISAFAARRWPERAKITTVGANAWWLLTLGSLLAIATSPWKPDSEGMGFVATFLSPLIAVPLFTVILCAQARNPEREPRRIAERLLQRLSRYLTFRRRWRKHTIAIDLRGAVLGLLVSAAVFGLLRPILKAPSAALLVGMIQMRNQEAQGAWSSSGTDDLSALLGWDLAQQNQRILTQRRQITLIDLDAPVLRAVFAPSARPARRSLPVQRPDNSSSSHAVSADSRPETAMQSETALDALLIRRLRSLGAAVIVLFPPVDGPAPPPGQGKSMATATNAETKRLDSLRDEPLLTAAIKEAGNVVIALPSRESLLHSGLQTQTIKTRPISSAITGAAREAAGEELFSYGSVRLPVLPREDAKAPASLPVLIARLYARLTHSDTVYGFARRSLTPVDFSNARPDHDFLHIDASSLLMPSSTEAMRDERILTPDGQWRTLKESVSGRIVFLDTRTERRRETPLGPLPIREVLAYATATVLAHEKGLRVATAFSLLLTLFVGTVMGALCAHRTPFEAVGRLLGMAALIVFASLVCYMLRTLWLDAVVPLAAILLTYLLVTQLAFTQQREKNRDLLKRFVAPEFVDAMLDHPSDHLGLEGKLSHVCVLFADVRNFTGFAERHRPEEVFAAVNEYMTALTNALHAYGGVLDKYTGDGLMAWFPAEANTRRQIEKAVRATLAMRDAALEISRIRVEQNKPALAFGIGMHYGEAMIGLVGNEEHQINYTALGHAVIVSARLQTLAAGGEVIISEAIFTALDGTFQVEARDPVAVKGIYELVRPYLVLSA